MTKEPKLRTIGPVEGMPSRFSTVAKLIESEGVDYVRGYFRGAVAVARQLDASGQLARRVREACRLNLTYYPEILKRVEQDWGVW